MTATAPDTETYTKIDVGALATDASISRDRAELLLERFGSIEAVAKNAIERPDILTDQDDIGETTKEKVVEFAEMFLSPLGGTLEEDGFADHVDMSVIPDPVDYEANNDTNSASEEEEYVIRSPNRPLTRNAKHALKPFGIIEELDSTGSMGRNNGVRVENLPPESVLDEHELVVEQDPAVVYETDTGSTVYVYVDPDKVIADGTETSLTPVEAAEHAAQAQWDIIENNPDIEITG